MNREGGSRRVHRLGLAVISCLIVGLLCLAWLVLSEPAPETAAAVPVTAAATEMETSAAAPASETVEHEALLREALTEQLKKLGVFVDQDGLKTQKVLDHYFGAELEAGHE